MRKHLADFLFLLCLSAVVEASERETYVGNMDARSSLSHSKRVTVASKRFLRVSEVPTTEDEMESRNKLLEADRVVQSLHLSGIEKDVAKQVLDLSNQEKEIKPKPPAEVSKMLHIKEAEDVIKEVRIVVFARYANEYRKRFGVDSFPVEDLYATLKSSTSARRVAIISHLLQEIDDLRPLGEQLQDYQFELWRKKGGLEKAKSVLGKNKVASEGTIEYQIYHEFNNRLLQPVFTTAGYE
ncbi:hypothetical protein PsorP6_003033 [Peronosclerospora sorghi]|uniref:Uncharacterized protein n=1 Tax=Peronosclerospora sorghi TaxID=230839 RepID=A0ACC0VQK8_9STRA|nr:hypothetical protein PsorP6_003033 [Peronosclerospora sorghi]